MEEDPKYFDPTVEMTVHPHPDADAPPPAIRHPVELTYQTPTTDTTTQTPTTDTTTQTVPPEEEVSVMRSPSYECCPVLPPIVPPCAMTIDLRDLSTTLLGTFAMGATVALALAYFSRAKVSTDA